MREALRSGITLIEMLVALIILSVLVAAIFPVVTSQLEDTDPARAANDLANLRTGIELFALNVRPSYPGDIEDLVHEISAVSTDEDKDVTGTNFVTGDVTRWRGPYVDLAAAEKSDGASATGDVGVTGFDGNIQNELVCYNASANTLGGTTCVQGDSFVALVVHDLSTAAYEAINDLIDGEAETAADATAANGTGDETGRVRLLDPDGTPSDASGDEYLYFLAVPYRQ